MSMNLEERMHLAEEVFARIPEQVTRKEKRIFAIHIFAVFLCYSWTLGKIEKMEKRRGEYVGDEETDRYLCERILAKCDEVWGLRKPEEAG